jgi:hypothetical protein
MGHCAIYQGVSGWGSSSHSDPQDQIIRGGPSNHLKASALTIRAQYKFPGVGGHFVRQNVKMTDQR